MANVFESTLFQQNLSTPQNIITLPRDYDVSEYFENPYATPSQEYDDGACSLTCCNPDQTHVPNQIPYIEMNTDFQCHNTGVSRPNSQFQPIHEFITEFNMSHGSFHAQLQDLYDEQSSSSSSSWDEMPSFAFPDVNDAPLVDTTGAMPSLECVGHRSSSVRHIDYQKRARHSFDSLKADEYQVELSPYFSLPQTVAASRLGTRPSTLSRRWKEATNNKGWPYRALRKLDREIATLLKNIQINPYPQISNELSQELGRLLSSRKVCLAPVTIYLKQKK